MKPYLITREREPLLFELCQLASESRREFPGNSYLTPDGQTARNWEMELRGLSEADRSLLIIGSPLALERIVTQTCQWRYHGFHAFVESCEAV